MNPARDPKNYARTLGCSYLAYTLVGWINVFLIKPGIKNVDMFVENANRFRLAQLTDLVMFSLVIVASWASFLLARSVSRELALLAFAFRFGEALLGCVAVMVMLMPLVLLEGGSSWAAFDGEQVRALASQFIKLSGAMWNVLFVLMGIGACLFMTLFHVSRTMPRWLTVWGMFTYGSMMLYGLIKLGVSDPPSGMKLAMVPGTLFELAFAVWLLAKGVDAQRALRL